jgi:hypothetical protein
MYEGGQHQFILFKEIIRKRGILWGMSLFSFIFLSDKIGKILESVIRRLEYGFEAINKGLDKTLEEGLLLEAELSSKTCYAEDSKEGTKAFLEKRKAVFQGR